MRKHRQMIVKLLIACLLMTGSAPVCVLADEPVYTITTDASEIPPETLYEAEDVLTPTDDAGGEEYEYAGPVGTVSDFDLDYEVPSLEPDVLLLRSSRGLTSDASTSLPDKYDPFEEGRIIAPVRNQGSFGSCWAFASIGAMEADGHDKTVSSPDLFTQDLSELHLAYYAASKYEDPQHCHNDIVEYRVNNWLDNGGHIVVASRLLTELVGAIPEEDANYSTGLSFAPDDSYITSRDRIQVRNAYYINPKDREDIKRAILEHGAVAASYKDVSSSYNSDNNCYYYDQAGHNHAVMFVGWNDDFSADNFTKSPGKDKNGAWLVRNSWGYNGYGHSGYFWMSYYDVGWNSTKEVIAFDTSDELYDNCYAYDGDFVSGTNWLLSPSNTVSVTYDVPKGDSVRAVAFELATANVQAYVTVTNRKTGESVSKSIRTSYAGIYTAEFDTPLEFPEDAEAEVKLRFDAGKDSDGKNNEISFVCEKPGESKQFGNTDYYFVFTGVCDRGFDVGSKHFDTDPRVRLYTDSKHVRVDSVRLNTSSVKLPIGDTQKLSAEVLPANATYKGLSWSSSNTDVATVSSSGAVKGISPGIATITATTKDRGRTASCKVTVAVPVSGVSLNRSSATVKVGSKLTLTARILPDNATNRNVTWKSSNTGIATVSSSGVIKGKKAGKATITVTTADGKKTAKCIVTIKNVPATKIVLSKTKATVYSGKKLQLKATISPDNTTDKTVKWTSGNKKIATVSSKGVVKAVSKKKATVTITAKTANGKKATCKITVKPIKVTKVTLNKKKVTISEGKKVTLKATVKPTDATDKKVTWKSKDTDVATVSSKGVVKGIKEGTTVITVTTKDGKKTAKCTVTVE